MRDQAKSEKYSQMCYMYGLTAILVILQQYDSEGNWQECQIILDALLTMEYFPGVMVPGNYGKQAQDYFVGLLRLITGRDGIEVFNYLQPHIQVIKDYVK